MSKKNPVKTGQVKTSADLFWRFLDEGVAAFITKIIGNTEANNQALRTNFVLI
jgi:hypothetical protein